ncbi:phage tail protein [Trichonephila clavata]|uniref:Phage tail protein n=1 Tax=Trichonephila clavata TaxID=2740835 RepID=A0A8X6IIP8_TRICU|nr:phage tail protein [Trichonephila clavata]
MKPDFNIIAENNSITEALRSSLISLHITDESGTTSDEAEICLEYGSMNSRDRDEHEATVKTIGGHIIFIPKGGGNQQQGRFRHNVTDTQDVINWKVNFNVRSKYGSVIAKWYSYERGETIEEKVGNEEPSYPIYKLYPTAESAISAASAKLRRLKRGEAKLNVTIPGNPELFAEAKINCWGFVRK